MRVVGGQKCRMLLRDFKDFIRRHCQKGDQIANGMGEIRPLCLSHISLVLEILKNIRRPHILLEASFSFSSLLKS